MSEENVYDNYAAWTDSVAQYPPTAEPFYLALGISDEVGELIRARGADEELAESGDVLWYCARYATKVLHVPFSAIVTAASATSVHNTLVEAHQGIICGVEKKRIRDGESWSETKRAEKSGEAMEALIGVVCWVRTILESRRMSIAEALAANRLKLSARLDAGTIQGDGDKR